MCVFCWEHMHSYPFIKYLEMVILGYKMGAYLTYIFNFTRKC